MVEEEPVADSGVGESSDYREEMECWQGLREQGLMCFSRPAGTGTRRTALHKGCWRDNADYGPVSVLNSLTPRIS